MILSPTSAVTTSTATTASAGTSGVGDAALGSLTGNFSNFLRMLMTQLQNQDPTSPMDTNEFTRELVQFSSVEQQIKTNTSLTRLIELTQAGEVMQSSAMIGRQVTIENDQMPLQSGRGTVRFSLPADQPVVVSILNDKGEALAEASVAGRRGGNDWSWDGKAANGKTQPDGAYRVAVHALGADGTPRAVAFQVVGTASGVVSDGTGVRLQLGEVSVPFSRVRAVGG